MVQSENHSVNDSLMSLGGKAYLRVPARKLVGPEFAAGRPSGRRNTGRSGGGFMLNIQVCLNALQTMVKERSDYLVRREIHELIPIGIDFEIVIYPHEDHDDTRKADSHVKDKASIGCAHFGTVNRRAERELGSRY